MNTIVLKNNESNKLHEKNVRIKITSGQIKITGKIESVNGAMLKSLLEEESDLVVFMFREDNRCQMGLQH